MDDYQIKVDGSGRVFVVLHKGCLIEKEKILELLREAGINEAEITFLPPEELDECGNLDQTSVLIPIDAAVYDSPELDDAGRHCGQAGGRVVVLLDNAFPYEGLHPIAEKYGTQCGWSAEQLGPCLFGGELIEPRSGSGGAVVRPGARQVKC